MAGDTNTVVHLAEAKTGTTEAHAAPAGDAHAATGTETGTAAHGAGSEGFPPFDPSGFGSQLLWLAITFAALYVLMSKLALPRIGEILEVRRDRIESDLAEADRLRQKTDQAIKTYEAELADARQKAHSMAEETRQTIKAETDAARSKAEGELTKKISAAEARIQETKDAALANVDQIAAQTASAVVAKIAGKVTAKQARDAVAEAIKE